MGRSDEVADEWIYVGAEEVTQRSGAHRQQLRDMLTRADYAEVPDQDVKVDLLCTRGTEPRSSIRVWVRREPRPARPKRRPRHKP